MVASSPSPVAAESSAPAVATAVPSLASEELAKHKTRAKHISAAFGEIVSLLMRDPASKHHSLADLEWLVVPPLLAGQFSLAEAQSKSTGHGEDDGRGRQDRPGDGRAV